MSEASHRYECMCTGRFSVVHQYVARYLKYLKSGRCRNISEVFGEFVFICLVLIHVCDLHQPGINTEFYNFTELYLVFKQELCFEFVLTYSSKSLELVQVYFLLKK